MANQPVRQGNNVSPGTIARRKAIRRKKLMKKRLILGGMIAAVVCVIIFIIILLLKKASYVSLFNSGLWLQSKHLKEIIQYKIH